MAPFHPKPTFVITPGAALQPAHYGLLMHLLMEAGYGVLCSMLPSTGTGPGKKATVEEDVAFIRDRMILPVIDHEEHDVILIGHSYSGLPCSPAVAGLSKSDRAKAGKKTSVLAQIFISSLITKGGDGKDMIDTFGGQAPPHVVLDETANVVRCPGVKNAFFADVADPMADSASASCMDPNLTSWRSPIPRSSLDEPGYAGRLAYIKTTADAALPTFVQEMLMEGTGVEYVTREMATSHNAQIAQPHKLKDILVELAEHFEKL